MSFVNTTTTWARYAHSTRVRADHAQNCEDDRGRVRLLGLGNFILIWDRDGHDHEGQR